MKIFVATHNQHKVREMGEILSGIEIVPDDPEGVEENAPDFAGNALIKVRAIAQRHRGEWCMADDSGLEVSALGGQPGVHSARYAGEPSDTKKNNALLLENLKGTKDRSARFVCCCALVSPTGEEIVVEGECRGRIAEQPSGVEGFGYDPLFVPDGFDKSFAELSAAEKNAISHRGRALEKVKDRLKVEGERLNSGIDNHCSVAETKEKKHHCSTFNLQPSTSLQSGISYRIFGESHSAEIGIEVQGMPKTEVDMARVNAFMARRAANAPRKEPDALTFDWRGDTLRITILNVDQRPQDYANILTVPRPGHADYSSWITTGHIPTGGGKWSGRMTAPLCAAGAVALQILEKRGITVSARVVECDGRKGGDLAMLNEVPADDSCGAVVEAVAVGVPAGLGDAGTDGLESKFASALFGISAVKGVEFGDGFRLAAMRGSEANDPWIVKDGKVTLKTNHCGGILGGISIGMPIVARVAFKPTPSISREQDSVDLATMQPTKLKIRGRHDKCVAFRGCPVVEAAMALVILGEIS